MDCYVAAGSGAHISQEVGDFESRQAPRAAHCYL
jgi:hypothetical protein